MATLLADRLEPSALVIGDTFFGLLARRARALWLPEAHAVTSTADLGEVTVEGPTGTIDARLTRARAVVIGEQSRELVPGTPAAVQWRRIGEADRH